MSPHQFAAAPQSRKSNRQLLKKTPNFPCLVRRSPSKPYYGICQFRGNRKEHSLKTTDREACLGDGSCTFPLIMPGDAFCASRGETAGMGLPPQRRAGAKRTF
jgi:hypothetical protein